MGPSGMPRSQIGVAYDDEYLYASGRFYDSRPAEIRVDSLYRDRWSGDDTFQRFVDGFNATGSAGSEPSSAL